MSCQYPTVKPCYVVIDPDAGGDDCPASDDSDQECHREPSSTTCWCVQRKLPRTHFSWFCFDASIVDSGDGKGEALCFRDKHVCYLSEIERFSQGMVEDSDDDEEEEEDDDDGIYKNVCHEAPDDIIRTDFTYKTHKWYYFYILDSEATQETKEYCGNYWESKTLLFDNVPLSNAHVHIKIPLSFKK